MAPPPPPELPQRLAPTAILAAGLGLGQQPSRPDQTITQMWMVYDWLVHHALPSLLESAELPELSERLIGLPWCFQDPAKYREVSTGVWEVTKALTETLDGPTQLRAKQSWGWSWGAQTELIVATGLPAALTVIRDCMSRTAAGPPAKLLRLISMLFVMPPELAVQLHTDAALLLDALYTVTPENNPALARTPYPPVFELINPPDPEPDLVADPTRPAAQGATHRRAVRRQGQS